MLLKEDQEVVYYSRFWDENLMLRFLSQVSIGQLHDDDIWLQLPEFISVLLCYLNLSTPLRIKEQ